MGFKTFTAGSVLTAADVDNYLMNQSVIVCTSGTRPTSPVAGMTIYETDTNRIRTYNGTTWCLDHYVNTADAPLTAFTPAASNAWTWTTSTAAGKYRIHNGILECWGYLVSNATGTGGAQPSNVYGPSGFTPTVTASGGSSSNAGEVVGSFTIKNGATWYAGSVIYDGVTANEFLCVGSYPNWQPVSGDIVSYHLSYPVV